MNNFLLQIVTDLNKHKEHFSSKPTGIRINEKWLDEEISKGKLFVERTYLKSTLPNHFGGLPVTYDENINTYEIIYKDGE